MAETAIQAKIRAELEANGWTVFRLSKTGKRGDPDLLAMRYSDNGLEAQFYEIKVQGKKRTPIQKHTANKLTKAGFKVMCVTTDFETVNETPLQTYEDLGF
jgi:Holliday junction resolvase